MKIKNNWVTLDNKIHFNMCNIMSIVKYNDPFKQIGISFKNSSSQIFSENITEDEDNYVEFSKFYDYFTNEFDHTRSYGQSNC